LDIKLLSKKHEIVVIIVRDRFEENLTTLGNINLKDLENGFEYNGVVNTQALKDYKEQIKKNDHILYEHLRKCKVNEIMNELKINDIKGLVSILDYSYFIYIFLIVATVLIIIIILLQLIRIFYKRKKSDEQIAYEILEKLDLNNTKDAAYKITKYGRVASTDNRSKRLFFQLEEKLEKYKYKKEVAKFDEDIINEYKRFVDAIDV
jgi:hypothetical protein